MNPLFLCCLKIGFQRFWEESLKTFYYRLKVLRRNLLKENEVHEIVPVKACGDKEPIISSTQPDDIIHIRGNGVEIELPMSVSPDMITVILQGIRSC